MKKRKKLSASTLLIHGFLSVFSLACLLPMLLVLSTSLTDEKFLRIHGISLIPGKFSLFAYEYILADPQQIIRSYGISILITVVGTFLSLWFTSSLAYVVSRRDYAYANATSLLIFITMLFGVGMTPQYLIMVNVLHLKNNLFSLILPNLIGGFNVMLLKGYMQGLPASMFESAKIDGASEWRIYFRIALPVAIPGLATVSLFNVFNFWNDWQNAMLYIDDFKNAPLQLLLQRIIMNIEYILKVMSPAISRDFVANLPSMGARMALCLIATGPILFVFLIFQKYLVSGLVVGSVKG